MRWLAYLAIGLVLASCATVPAPSAAEREAVERSIDRWNTAWRTKDAALAASDYSADADFTNAFGQARQGRREIERLLAEVFALPFVMAGESRVVEQTVRFPSPDVAVATTLVERRGQQSANGEPLGPRQTSHLRVFLKTDGRWVIVSHLISDARDTKAAAH